MAKMRIARLGIAAAAMTALAVPLGGCGGGRIDLDPGGWFSGIGSGLGRLTDEGGFTVSRGDPSATTLRAVTASDLVGPDGRCEAVSSEPTSTPAPRAVSLTMTECELVTIAGAPEQVNVGANESGERRTVLTYGKGDNPGIYTFVSGRLKIIERLPTPPKPEPRRRAPKKKTA